MLMRHTMDVVLVNTVESLLRALPSNVFVMLFVTNSETVVKILLL